MELAAPARRTTSASAVPEPDLKVGVGMATVGFYIAGLGAVLIVLAGDLGTTPEALAWVGSVFGVGLLAVALAGPALLRHGRYPVLAGGALALAAGSAVVALSFALPVIAVGAVLQALGAAALLLVSPTLLTGPSAATRLTRVNAAASTAGVLAPLALGALVAVGIAGRLAILAVVPPMLFLAWGSVLAHRAETDGRAEAGASADGAPGGGSGHGSGHGPSRATVARRWLTMVLAVAVEFCFAVWGVARLVDSGLDTGAAAALGAAFPIGMAIGRIAGPQVIARVPAVPAGAAATAVGTVLVVAGTGPAAVIAGLCVAGLGVATLYPVTLAHLMATPGLSPAHGASLGAVASGTAIIVAPAGLATLAGVVDLRLAFLVTIPLLAALVALDYRRPVAQRTA